MEEEDQALPMAEGQFQRQEGRNENFSMQEPAQVTREMFNFLMQKMNDENQKILHMVEKDKPRANEEANSLRDQEIRPEEKVLYRNYA
ncbi:hypothetical protein NL676_000040 [Syzygium grande]|nr:hypothetical protein NL676_000040 [Syzygium grande]